jgi:hypothetical protein
MMTDTEQKLAADKYALDSIWDGIVLLNNADHPAWNALAYVESRLTARPQSAQTEDLVKALEQVELILRVGPSRTVERALAVAVEALSDHRAKGEG